MKIEYKRILGSLLVFWSVVLIWIFVFGLQDSSKLHIPGVVTTDNYTDPTMIIDGMDPQQDLVYVTIAVRDRVLFEEVQGIMKEIKKQRIKRK